jgi:hypothetical protein
VIYQNRLSGACGASPLGKPGSLLRARNVVTRGGMISRFPLCAVSLLPSHVAAGDAGIAGSVPPERLS